MVMTMTTNPALSGDGLYRLMAWLSPGFPVGAYTYSHGIEFAVEDGLITDAGTLTRWIEGIIRFGAGRVDAGLFRAAWEAAGEENDDRLAWTIERADALRGTGETALESSAQGRAFLDTLIAAWPDPAFGRLQELLEALDRPPAYAVAVGVAANRAGVALEAALTAYLLSLAANLVSAAVRLVPLGQTDGQKTLAALEPVVAQAVKAALEGAPEDLGSAAPMVDWTSLQHETQYTRLFRS